MRKTIFHSESVFYFFYVDSVLHMGSVFQSDLLLCLNLDTTLDLEGDLCYFSFRLILGLHSLLRICFSRGFVFFTQTQFFTETLFFTQICFSLRSVLHSLCFPLSICSSLKPWSSIEFGSSFGWYFSIRDYSSFRSFSSFGHFCSLTLLHTNSAIH